MKVFKRKYRANPITKTIVERVKAEKFEIPTDCSNAEREFFLDRINSFKKLNKRVKVIITDKLGDDFKSSKSSLDVFPETKPINEFGSNFANWINKMKSYKVII